MNIFRPMLAAPMDADKGQSVDTLTYPVGATPKIDGCRCLIIDGVAMSRTMKPIPNRFIQAFFADGKHNGLDGELLVGKTFQAATSGIMSEDGEPDFTYYAFDVWDQPDEIYHWRMINMLSRYEPNPRVVFLTPKVVNNAKDLKAYIEEQLALGHEGVMVRSMVGPYKNGRATWKEGYLTKCKPFEDAEATVVGFEEAMHNGNEATKDAFGRTERSSHKANLTGKGTLGALVCENQKLWPGQTFNIGTGFDQATRDELWKGAGRLPHRPAREVPLPGDRHEGQTPVPEFSRLQKPNRSVTYAQTQLSRHPVPSGRQDPTQRRLLPQDISGHPSEGRRRRLRGRPHRTPVKG